MTTMGHVMSDDEQNLLLGAVSPSNHPNSQAIRQWLQGSTPLQFDSWHEYPGEGVVAIRQGVEVKVGNARFAGVDSQWHEKARAGTYANIDGNITGFFLEPDIRPGVKDAIRKLSGRFQLSVLSGDHDKQRPLMERLLGKGNQFLFEQKPLDKLKYIEDLQRKGKRVAMLGDGLNDAGALQQSNAGIALADNVNNFTPACDAILDAANIAALPALLQLARQSARVLRLAFIVSIIYNIIGLSFAMRGLMQPVMAAILMPCSTLSIVIISSGLSNLLAWKDGLKIKGE
ncbi:MAG: HAD family hydrolase [Chitinophagia bacterium]|nr:HAD family hydrolase [Chitinophagia bacterium]